MAPIYLNEEKNTRYKELLAKFDDLEDKELEELNKLRKELQTNKGKRSADILKVQKQVTELGLSLEEMFGASLGDVIKAQGLTIDRLFPQETIREYAVSIGLGGKAGKPAASGESTPRAPRRERPSDANPVLLTRPTPSGVGRAFQYKQGRIFEQASDTVKTPYVYADKQFPAALFENSTKAELLKLATPEGKTFFATPDGQVELDKILDVIKTAHTKLKKPA